jgi:Amt family ammonium transporter
MVSRSIFFPVIAMFLLVVLIVAFPGDVSEVKKIVQINGADTAWMLMASALVLVMTPGLAFFYGGMVNKKNVISTMLQSIICMVVVTVLWVVAGFSVVFGDSVVGLFGNPKTYFMMRGVIEGAPWKMAPTIPFVLFAFYQLKFAIIAPALITGAFAERIRFKSYIVFIVLFSLFIYCPIAHATWHPDGILARFGVLDFAGGTVVHMSAGWAALASAIYLKSRNSQTHNPARITYVILGTGLLWFGWFGFNAGSAFGANNIAATALAITMTCSATAAFAWIVFDAMRGRLPSAMGSCIGAVVGLVAITPAAGFVSIPHALAIGIISSVISNMMVEWRTRTSVDDTLDVFPCHGVGGIVGMLLTGVFADRNINSVVTDNGLLFGETKLFFIQLVAMVAVSVFCLVTSFVLLKVTDLITPLRVTRDEELKGLDLSQHGESL